MPCIKHGDLLLAQSQATALYAAELGIHANGVLGDNAPVNRAMDSMVMGAHADLQAAMYKCLFGNDESKAKGKEELQGKVNTLMGGLERMLDRKTTAGPYFF